jgi:phage N-6-adenine-methyltransferase
MTKRETVTHSSVFSDWGTPAEVFDPLDRYFGFCLDVCASAENAKVPSNYFGLDHVDAARRNALAADWRTAAASGGFDLPAGLQLFEGKRIGATAFMNPPFSRELHIPIEPWIAKACYEAERGLTVVGLVPASVQTAWWKRWVRRADEIWFVQHRIRYVASEVMLGAINAKRLEQKKKPIAQAWGAGNNSAIVVWRPDPGFVGHAEPIIRYWSWKRA